MWIRAIIAFAVVILVITEAGAQDGADNRCGRRVCRQNECCTERRFYGRTIRMCRRIPRENGLCGGNNFCPCPEGLECKPTYTGIFFRINQCKKIGSSTTTTSTSTESISTVTSTPTESMSTDDWAETSTTIGGSTMTSSSTEIPTTVGGDDQN